MGFLENANSWENLGIPASIGKFEKELLQIKIINSIRRLSKSDTERSIMKDGYNFLCIDISDSPIFCVDIDNEADSVKNFHNYIEKNKISLEDFFYEKTRNGGYHLYFRSEEKSTNIMNKFYSGIKIDILFNGRIFTSPSNFGDKKYEQGSIKIKDIKSINDINEIPEWMDNLLCHPD